MNLEYGIWAWLTQEDYHSASDFYMKKNMSQIILKSQIQSQKMYNIYQQRINLNFFDTIRKKLINIPMNSTWVIKLHFSNERIMDYYLLTSLNFSAGFLSGITVTNLES